MKKNILTAAIAAVLIFYFGAVCAEVLKFDGNFLFSWERNYFRSVKGTDAYHCLIYQTRTARAPGSRLVFGGIPPHATQVAFKYFGGQLEVKFSSNPNDAVGVFFPASVSSTEVRIPVPFGAELVFFKGRANEILCIGEVVETFAN